MVTLAKYFYSHQNVLRDQTLNNVPRLLLLLFSFLHNHHLGPMHNPEIECCPHPLEKEPS